MVQQVGAVLKTSKPETINVDIYENFNAIHKLFYKDSYWYHARLR